MSPDPSPEDLLRETDLFRVLDRRTQQDLFEQARVLPFKDGEVLMRTGTEGRALHVLLEGKAEVRVRDGDQTYRVAVLEPGAIFGEMAFFAGNGPRTADVIARSPGIVAAIGYDFYERMCRQDPTAAAALEKAVLSVLADRLEETNRMMATLMDDYKTGGVQAASNWLSRFFRAKG